MNELKWFVVTFGNSSDLKVQAENIYKAIDQLIVINKIRPKEIESIREI